MAFRVMAEYEVKAKPRDGQPRDDFIRGEKRIRDVVVVPRLAYAVERLPYFCNI